jgi:hypothetical protein
MVPEVVMDFDYSKPTARGKVMAKNIIRGGWINIIIAHLTPVLQSIKA